MMRVSVRHYLLLEQATNLNEIYLEDARIIHDWHSDEAKAMFNSDLSDHGHYLFMQCHRQERLSAKKFASWYMSCIYHSNQLPQCLSQGMLIKLVRYHLTLHWLGSDLTDENIAMLQRGRPEVTLANECMIT